MTLLERARAVLAGARAYRFQGEQENHADLLRERRVSLSMMEAADPENPDQVRMASEIEHDAENRLTVLLGKARLTLAEKRERDAIQAAIAGRRQGFGDAPPVLVERTQETRLARFLGPLAASPALAILLSPWTWLVVSLGLLGLQTGRIGNLKDDVRDLRADVAMAERSLTAARAERDLLAEAAIQADTNARQTARNVETERRLRNRAETELRRARRAIEQAGSDGPIDYGFGGVRPDGEAPGGAAADSAGSGSGDTR